MLAAQKPEEVIAKARDLIQKKQLADARNILGILTRQHPEFVPGWLLFGAVQENTDRKKEAWRKAYELDPSDQITIKALASVGEVVQPGKKPQSQTMTALPERPMDDAERAAFAAAANAPAQPAAQSPAAPAAPVVPQAPQLITPPRKRFRDYIPAKWRKKAASLVETPVSGTPEHPSTGATQPNLGAPPPAVTAAPAATAAPPGASAAPAAPPGRAQRSRMAIVLVVLACALSLVSAFIAWRTTSDLRNANNIFATQTATARAATIEEPPPAADTTPQALPTDASNPAPEATAAPAAPATTPTNQPTATRPPVPTVPSAPTDTPPPAVSGQLVPAGDQLIVPDATQEPGR